MTGLQRGGGGGEGGSYIVVSSGVFGNPRKLWLFLLPGVKHQPEATAPVLWVFSCLLERVYTELARTGLLLYWIYTLYMNGHLTLS